MENILIINTGGTFNKIYNPINGKLEIDDTQLALDDISSKWQFKFKIIDIINKDSLDISNGDRLLLLATINIYEYDRIVIIHGTDTMNKSAAYLAESDIEKKIIFTGAMIPYSIDPVEATANLCYTLGYIQHIKDDGIYISMNGTLDKHQKVKKNREKGFFVKHNQ